MTATTTSPSPRGRQAKEKFIPAAKVRRVIEDFIPRDKIFTVVFRKVGDNTISTMNCRRDVRKNLIGTPRKVSANCLNVFDLQVKDYRAFRLDRVLEIRTDGLSIRAS